MANTVDKQEGKVGVKMEPSLCTGSTIHGASLCIKLKINKKSLLFMSKSNPVNGDLEKFLVSHNILPTARRLQVLKILLTIPNTEFSLGEIYALIKKEDSSASTSSVVNTLKLFKNTGLIKEVSTKRDNSLSNRKKGRTEKKYISSNSLRW